MVPRITKYGRLAKAKYRKIKRGGVMMDEHRYVMEQHLGRKLERNECVHHKDGDQYNNALENLELVSRAEHSRLHMRGVGSNTVKLTEQQVREIRSSTERQWRLALQYGVSEATIGDIRNFKTWTHLE